MAMDSSSPSSAASEEAPAAAAKTISDATASSVDPDVPSEA